MPLDDTLAIEKLARDSPDKILEFQLKVGDLRRTADEMQAGFEFVLNLWRYFEQRDRYFSQLELAEDGLLPAPPHTEHPSLPKRPPEPRNINPHQYGEGHGERT
jgi:hypothetical protein